MNRGRKRLFTVLVAVLIALSLLAGFAAAAGTGGQAGTYPEIPLYVQGIRVGSGLMVQNTIYVPFRVFCQALGNDVSVGWDENSQTATAEMTGLEVSAQVNTAYVQANGRYFYAPSGVLWYSDAVYVPVNALAKAFTLNVIWNDEYQIVDVDVDNMAPVVSGNAFYNQNDLDLLSRLIFSEAGNQPLSGQIGVGDVVLNRVNSSSFPSTIYDVIYAPGQFDVVPSGAINMSPSADSILAAKLCLDGANTVGNSLHYFNPSLANPSWAASKTLIVSIGQHDFYT